MYRNNKYSLGITLASGVLFTSALFSNSSAYTLSNDQTGQIELHEESKGLLSNKDKDLLVNRIRKYEKKLFTINNGFGDVSKIPTPDDSTSISKDNGYEYIKGSKKILISAPHSLKQPPRPGTTDFKLADSYTGSIAKYIAEETGAHVIYKSSYTGVDDNFMGYGIDNPSKEETVTPYRDKMEEVIKENEIELVIDLHGFADSSDRNFGVILGTNNGKNLLNNKSLLNAIKKSFNDSGFSELTDDSAGNQQNYVIDKLYPASIKNRSITNYVATNLNTPAIQVELSKTNRDPNNKSNLSRTVDVLMDIINKIDDLSPSVAEITSKKSSTVGLKSEPRLSSESIVQLKLGTVVEKVETVGKNFVKVIYVDKSNKYTGYIHKNNLKKIEL